MCHNNIWQLTRGVQALLGEEDVLKEPPDQVSRPETNGTGRRRNPAL